MLDAAWVMPDHADMSVSYLGRNIHVSGLPQQQCRAGSSTALAAVQRWQQYSAGVLLHVMLMSISAGLIMAKHIICEMC
jgi:hypothetical protein